jgi:hypothetical protein
MGPPTRLPVLKDDRIAQRPPFHDFNCACFRTEFSVPRGISLLGLPATVTSPGFVECLY